MMKMEKTNIKELLYWILAFLPVIVTAVVFPAFPDTIPAHFDSAGAVNRYGSRLELFIMPLTVILAALFFKVFFNKIAAITQEQAENTNRIIITVSKFVILAIFNLISYVLLYNTYASAGSKAEADIYKIAAVTLCIGDLFIANVLPKCRQNGLTGIRTKWTLADQDVWYKAHRAGGFIIAGGSILLLFICLLLHGIACLYTLLAGYILMITGITIYSYRLYKLKHEK